MLYDLAGKGFSIIKHCSTNKLLYLEDYLCCVSLHLINYEETRVRNRVQSVLQAYSVPVLRNSCISSEKDSGVQFYDVNVCFGSAAKMNEIRCHYSWQAHVH